MSHELPDYQVTEETRAAARRAVIVEIQKLKIDDQIAFVKAFTNLGQVYADTATIRAHQENELKAIAYTKCATEVQQIAAGVLAGLQTRLEELVKQ